MKPIIRVASAGCLALGLGVVTLLAQTTGTAEAHRAAAKVAGKNHPGLLAALCPERPAGGAAPARANTPPPQAAQAAGQRGQTPGPAVAPRPAPPREQWHAEPVKVFDNLYWFGQT